MFYNRATLSYLDEIFTLYPAFLQDSERIVLLVFPCSVCKFTTFTECRVLPPFERYLLWQPQDFYTNLTYKYAFAYHTLLLESLVTHYWETMSSLHSYRYGWNLWNLQTKPRQVDYAIFTELYENITLSTNLLSTLLFLAFLSPQQQPHLIHNRERNFPSPLHSPKSDSLKGWLGTLAFR